MPFWSDPTTDPKRQYRWLMYINNLPQWIVKQVNKPSYSITESPHVYINHTFYYPGKVEYDPISVTLVDPISPDATEKMVQILKASGYAFPDDPNDTTTISKARAVSALGNVSIQQLGAEGGDVIERIDLRNAWVRSVRLGDLNYESDDLVNIELEIRYDYFEFVATPPREGLFGTLQSITDSFR